MSHQELESDAQRIELIEAMLREFPSIRIKIIDWLWRFHAKEVQEHLPVS